MSHLGCHAASSPVMTSYSTFLTILHNSSSSFHSSSWQLSSEHFLYLWHLFQNKGPKPAHNTLGGVSHMSCRWYGKFPHCSLQMICIWTWGLPLPYSLQLLLAFLAKDCFSTIYPNLFFSSASSNILSSILYVYFLFFLPMCILLHLLALNFSIQSLLHSSDNQLMSACNLSQSSTVLTLVNTLISSANIFTIHCRDSGMPFTYKRNKVKV